MKCPPMVISLKFRCNKEDEDRGGFGLWLPLFIIAPVILLILLALFLVALPFMLISLIITWNAGWLRYLWYGIHAFFKTMHELPGLKIDVEDRKNKIYIAVY